MGSEQACILYRTMHVLTSMRLGILDGGVARVPARALHRIRMGYAEKRVYASIPGAAWRRARARFSRFAKLNRKTQGEKI